MDLFFPPQQVCESVSAEVVGHFVKADKFDMRLHHIGVLYSKSYFLPQSVMSQIYF